MKISLVFSVLILSHSLRAQAVLPTQVRAANSMDQISNLGVGVGDVIFGIPAETGSKIEIFYFDKKWNKSSFSLYEPKNDFLGYYTKYDLKNQLVEVMTKNGIRVLDEYKMRSLTWVDSITGESHKFINSHEYVNSEGKNGELLELLVDGGVGLMMKTKIIIKKPDYVAAIDMGSRDEKWSKQVFFYLVTDLKLLRIKNKQSLFAVMPEQEDSINDFIKTNGLRTGRKEDLKKIVTFMNGLGKGN